jgi:hypothetical protein
MCVVRVAFASLYLSYAWVLSSLLRPGPKSGF